MESPVKEVSVSLQDKDQIENSGVTVCGVTPPETDVNPEVNQVHETFMQPGSETLSAEPEHVQLEVPEVMGDTAEASDNAVPGLFARHGITNVEQEADESMLEPIQSQTSICAVRDDLIPTAEAGLVDVTAPQNEDLALKNGSTISSAAASLASSKGAGSSEHQPFQEASTDHVDIEEVSPPEEFSDNELLAVANFKSTLKSSVTTSVVKTIASGRFSTVYLGHITDVTGPVALKVFDEWDCMERYESFIREAYLLKSLSHPNIVSYVGHGVNQLKERVIATNAGEGDLRYLRAPVGEHILVSIMADCLNGLAYLHGMNICHLDIRPQNIVVFPDNRVVICDLGSAKSMTSVVEVNYGSIPFMAPEIAKHKLGVAEIFSVVPELLASWDVWALGITLVILAEGLPWTGISNEDKLRQISEPQILKLKSEAWSSAMNSVVSKMLQRATENRVKSEDILREEWFVSHSVSHEQLIYSIRRGRCVVDEKDHFYDAVSEVAQKCEYFERNAIHVMRTNRLSAKDLREAQDRIKKLEERLSLLQSREEKYQESEKKIRELEKDKFNLDHDYFDVCEKNDALKKENEDLRARIASLDRKLKKRKEIEGASPESHKRARTSPERPSTSAGVPVVTHAGGAALNAGSNQNELVDAATPGNEDVLMHAESLDSAVNILPGIPHESSEHITVPRIPSAVVAPPVVVPAELDVTIHTASHSDAVAPIIETEIQLYGEPTSNIQQLTDADRSILGELSGTCMDRAVYKILTEKVIVPRGVRGIHTQAQYSMEAFRVFGPNGIPNYATATCYLCGVSYGNGDYRAINDRRRHHMMDVHEGRRRRGGTAGRRQQREPLTLRHKIKVVKEILERKIRGPVVHVEAPTDG